MPSTTTMRLVDFLPLMGQQVQGWYGKLQTSSASGVDNTLISTDFGDRGFYDKSELLDHWVLTPFDTVARRIVGYEPDSHTVTLSAGAAIQFQDRLEFWLFRDEPARYLEALVQALMDNPNLYSMYQDHVVRIADDEENLPEGGVSLTTFTTPDGAWRRYSDRIEIWLPNFNEVSQVMFGSPVEASLFDGQDKNGVFYQYPNRNDWNYERTKQTLTLKEWFWERVVTLTVKAPEISAASLVFADMNDAFTLSIGNPSTASSVYPDGLTSQHISTIVSEAIAIWANALSQSATGERALELNRWETHHRNRAARNYPVPPPIRK